MKSPNKQNATVVMLFAVGSLVLLNVLSVKAFARFDLTHDGAFTLADATKSTLEKLEDPITVTAYFTKELPPPFSSNARYVRDLLEEYRAASGGNVVFEFVDPQEQETTEDKEKKKDTKRDIFGRQVREKTSVESDLEKLGIQPVEIRVLEDDQAQTKRAYMGIAIRYQEKNEVIPVVQNTDSVEYDMTTMIRRLTRTKTPVLGVLQGHGEPSPNEELQKVTTLLSQNYEVRPIELTAQDGVVKVPDDVDALLVVGPKSTVSDEQLRAIDAFIMKGKSAAFFLDRVSVDLKTFQPTEVAHGVDGLIASYGVELGSQLVGDVECANLNVAERRGFMVIQMPVKYPFIPMPKQLLGDSPLTKGLGDVTLPFAVPLFKTDKEGVEITALAQSSKKSWLEDPAPEAMDPRRDWNSAQVTLTGPYNLIMQARGTLPSFSEPGKKSEGEARLVVVGTSAFISEQVMSQNNAALLMNIVDWMLLDPQLLAMRSRGFAEPPLTADLSETTRTVAKLGNVVGVPLLLILYGVIRWRQRESKRNKLKAA